MNTPLVRTGDWLARTVMLVLAALATLALIGSLAGVSNAPAGDASPGAAPQAAASAPSRPATPPSNPQFVEAGEGTMTIEAASAPVAAAPIREKPDETARWLKALTYAVLALTAVSAAGVVALVRIAAHLRSAGER